MRTKTLLLACAALALSLATSQAQVYSANIVGYVNYISRTNSPAYEMIDNPIDNGVNSLISLFPTPPGSSQVQIWQGASAVPPFLIATFSLGHWKTNGVTADGLVIPPGVGFFIKVGGTSPYTNTFVGTVDPNTGLFGTNVVNTGFQALSSMLPISDSVTNTATINLIVPGTTQVQKWNIANQAYDVYTYSLGNWKLGGVNTNLVIGLPEGFFVKNNGAAFNWVQTGP
jgi:hypothetical protein